MSNMNTATDEQLSTIRARAYNDTARAMSAGGVWLSHEQAKDLGGEALDWIGRRLLLNVFTTDECVACVPPGAPLPSKGFHRYVVRCNSTESPMAWARFTPNEKIIHHAEGEVVFECNVTADKIAAFESACDKDDDVLSYEEIS